MIMGKKEIRELHFWGQIVTRVVGGEAHTSDAIGSENTICSVFKVSTSFVKISSRSIPIILHNCNSLRSSFSMKGNHLEFIVRAVFF
jgi:hypothetical protein